MRRDAFYLDGPAGGRFCLVTHPAGASVGSLLYLHPFAEELNKSRRMVALGAAAFAARGWTVLQMDCFGCGDSAGDFGDASWHGWIDDVTRGWTWLTANCPPPHGLWSLRGGALLGAGWLCQADVCPPVLMWQPVASGKQHLTQFLRLKAVNEMLAESDAKSAMVGLRAELEAGRTIEIAGYRLSPPLAGGLGAATLVLPAAYAGAVAVLEVGAPGRTDISPAVGAAMAKWTATGVPVAAETVAGPAFWQTLEIETAPALIERSLPMLERFIR